MKLKFTILGCGSSGGVPRIDGNWGKCNPAEPKNRRTRCSLLVERGNPGKETRLLVDTSPDLRQQLLRTDTRRVDAVVYTHDHADHTHGIDELRVFALNASTKMPVYSDEITGQLLRERFSYCFRQAPNYPPTLEHRLFTALAPLTAGGPGGLITATPYPQAHAAITSYGFRFGGVAYSPDVSNLPPESVEHLQDLDVWIVDALRYQPHPGHFSVEQALSWIARLKPRRAILTHLHIDLDYETLRKELPPGVEPAYDGLTFEWEGPKG
jgi:phosphoribosyl 1,2-cyclic phosphate phosphodiesterase